MLKKLFYGGDYNPDQWDEATIAEDMRLFKKAHVNLLTLPVFSWAKLEPDEGVYDFEWLDKIIDTIWESGISICLATPTTAQPAWLSTRYPEVLPVDIAGRKRTHGMRVFFCVNSLKYRERAAAIAEQMALRYGRHPALAIWHVSNEYGTQCFCPTCQARFRVWLKRRYGSVEALNKAWSLAFWGRIVYSFEEITLPTELNDDYRFNPPIWLDYLRFLTDSTAECFLNEYNVLKKHTPNIPVTSNMSGYIRKLDQRVMNAHMDIAGWDNYPGPRDEMALVAFKHDTVRGLKDGQSYLLMESSPNQQNWQPYNKLKKPGEVRRMSYQALAHGADSVQFFQMRQSLGGQEKFHGALIAHAGHENTRIFRECAQLGAELETLGGRFVGARSQARVGLILDWNSWWALEGSSGPNRDIQLLEIATAYYKALYSRNIPVDVIAKDADFSRYDILITPMLYLVTESDGTKLQDYVRAGGTLVGTTLTGLADENDRCVYGEYPGLLREVFGLWVEETDALYPDERNHIEYGGVRYACSLVCDLIHPRGAEVLGRYCEDYYAAMPCVTVNKYGQGTGYYIGTQPDDTFLTQFFAELCDAKCIQPYFQAESDIEITLRESDAGKTFFVINHSAENRRVSFGADRLTDLLTGAAVTGDVTVKPQDVMVLAPL